MAIRVGVIGLNYGERVHLPAYKANPKYEVVAVCARTPGRAEEVAHTHHVPHWYTDARQLIASELDLISIASPPQTHSGFAAAAMAAGKDVVVEIGFVPGILEARVLLGMAQQFKRLGAPAYVMRYTPLLRVVSDLLVQNELGRPRFLRFDFFVNFLAMTPQSYRWMWDGDHGGGILMAFASHMLDLARQWFGPVAEVDSVLATFTEVAHTTGTVADDSGAVLLTFENGLLATLNYSAACAYPQTRIEIHGTEASLIIEGFGERASLMRMGEAAGEPVYPPAAYLEETRGHSGLPGGFSVFLTRLARALEEQKIPPTLPTLTDGWEVTRILEAIRVATRERRRVRVSEIT